MPTRTSEKLLSRRYGERRTKLEVHAFTCTERMPPALAPAAAGALQADQDARAGGVGRSYDPFFGRGPVGLSSMSVQAFCRLQYPVGPHSLRRPRSSA